MLRELDAELAAASYRSGRSLVWTAADREVLTLVGSTIDRRVDLVAAYTAAEDTKARVKLAAELRLTENALVRLLKSVQTDIPAPESQVTIKARRAAMKRWHPDAS